MVFLCTTAFNGLSSPIRVCVCVCVCVVTHLQIHDGTANERDHQKYGTGNLEDFDTTMPEQIPGEHKGAAGTANREGQQRYSVK